MTKKRSASYFLHEHLSSLDNGTELTVKDIQKVFPEYSSGAVSGFLHRAKEKGMVIIKGMKHNLLIYELVDNTVKWTFKPPSKGGIPNRIIEKREHEAVPMLSSSSSSSEPSESSEPSGEKQEPRQKELDLQVTPKTEKAFLSDQLFEMAAMIEKIEKRPLSFYTTDELIEELRKRIIGY